MSCSHKHNDQGQRRGERRCSGPIKRIVRGLAERLGVSRGVVIAGFVVGFVFVPMLTLLVGVGAWFWVKDPQRFEARVTDAADRARKVYDHTFGSSTPRSPDVETVMSEPLPDFPNLRRQFEALEGRAGAMEAYVSSEDFRLHREFRELGDKPQKA